MHHATRSGPPPHAVDNTDWLKTAAIIFVSAGHFGFFFMEDELWWSVFGRFAAPPFFFLLCYAQSRTVPLHWIGFGVILTLLESWNADWTWVAPNILLSFVLIRIARPYVQMLMQNRGWLAFVVLVSVLLALLPTAAKIVDYGAEGWLWALFGLCQRRYLDGISAVATTGGTRGSPEPTLTATDTAGLMRLLAAWSPRSSSFGRNKRNFRFRQFIWRSLFLASGFCPSACVYSHAARAASNPQRR